MAPELQSGSAETQLVFTELPVRDKLPASMPAHTQVDTDDIVTIQLWGLPLACLQRLVV